MIGPFLISLFGLLLFIVLNLILSLSDLMVDRGVGILTLLKLLFLKLPNLLVLALPVSGLFATFLGLGRLAHDREVIALEAAGISLRRISCPCSWLPVRRPGRFRPVQLGSPVVGTRIPTGLARNHLPPGDAAHPCQHVLQGAGGPVLLRPERRREGRKPSRGPRRRRRRTGFPQAQAAITLVTAEEGRWREQEWDLIAGRVYGYDREGDSCTWGPSTSSTWRSIGARQTSLRDLRRPRRWGSGNSARGWPFSGEAASRLTSSSSSPTSGARFHSPP